MEKDLWHTMRSSLQLYGHFQRIESLTGLGIPDVNYCLAPGHEGWLENKYIPRWPSDPTAVVPIKHYTAAQRLWARTRVMAGGRVHVMLMVGAPRVYLLLEGAWCAQHLTIDATRADIVEAASVMGLGRFPTADVIRQLTKK